MQRFGKEKNWGSRWGGPRRASKIAKVRGGLGEKQKQPGKEKVPCCTSVKPHGKDWGKRSLGNGGPPATGCWLIMGDNRKTTCAIVFKGPRGWGNQRWAGKPHWRKIYENGEKVGLKSQKSVKNKGSAQQQKKRDVRTENKNPFHSQGEGERKQGRRGGGVAGEGGNLRVQ